METSKSGTNHDVLLEQNDRRSLGPIETCNSDQKDAVLSAKTTHEGLDTYRLVILMLITLFCMHKRQGRSGNNGD